MIPAQFATPTAAIFLAGGLLTCFAGYRLFRFVLGLFGFLAGAMVATSVAGPTSTWTLLMTALVGGVVGAALMVVAYFVAVGLIGAGLAAALLNLVWRVIRIGGEPPTLVVVVVCVIGAVLALQAVRYVVIVGTGVAGSWTSLVGALALAGDPKALIAASAPNVWVVYPTDLLPSNWWVMIGGIALALAGIVVQLKTTTSSGKGKAPQAKSK
jgi:hypothetical protein